MRGHELLVHDACLREPSQLFEAARLAERGFGGQIAVRVLRRKRLESVRRPP